MGPTPLTSGESLTVKTELKVCLTTGHWRSFSSIFGNVKGRFRKLQVQTLKCLDYDLRYREIPEPFVVCGDYVPRRPFGAAKS